MDDLKVFFSSDELFYLCKIFLAHQNYESIYPIYELLGSRWNSRRNFGISDRFFVFGNKEFIDGFKRYRASQNES